MKRKTWWATPFLLRLYGWGMWRRLAWVFRGVPVGSKGKGHWTLQLYLDPRTGRYWSSAKSAREWLTETLEKVV